MVWISAFYTDGFAPKTALTPTIDIYRLSDNVLVVPGANMIEVGGGYYKYDFSTFDDREQYVIISDGGVGLVNMERYKFAGSAEAQSDSVLQMFDNEYLIDTALSTLNLKNRAGDTINKTWPLTDRNDSNIVLTGQGPANRKKRTL